MRTVPGRCNLCHEKRITKAYRKICDACAKKDDLCAKCQKPRHQPEAEEPEENEDFNESEEEVKSSEEEEEPSFDS